MFNSIGKLIVGLSLVLFSFGATAQTDAQIEALGLSTEQVQKIRQIDNAYDTKVTKINQDSQLTSAKKGEAILKEIQKRNDAIKLIFTSEQLDLVNNSPSKTGPR